MKKFLSMVAVVVGVVVLSGCISVGGPKSYSLGIQFSAANNAYRSIDTTIFETFSTVTKVLESLNIENYKKESNTKEAHFYFTYQNLNYQIDLKYTASSRTLVTVGAKSNGMFKNRQRAAEMLARIVEGQE
jgi:PBP1b-binding outer membrane lipoprotein LpoB